MDECEDVHGLGPPEPTFTDEQVQKLMDENAALKKRVKELEERNQRLDDLNQFMPYINNFYDEIFRSLRREYVERHGRGLCDWLYKHWSELFLAASIEQDDYDAKLCKEKPLNDSIDRCMMRIANISRDEWLALQEVRRERNQASHPKLNHSDAHKALARWNSDAAGLALKKVVRAATHGHRWR